MKRILKIILTILSSVVIVLTFYFIKFRYEAKTNGSITVELVNLESEVVDSKDIEFSKGDTLSHLVKEHFDNVEIENGFVYSIGSLSTPTDWSSYIGIYKNNVKSAVGIEDITFVDNDLISFRLTKDFSF